MKAPRIAIVAGEPSGDQLASGIITALKVIYPDAEFIGVAGPKMQAAGCDCLVPMDSFAVMGLIELLSSQLFNILKLRRQLVWQIAALKPNIFIGIDAPELNLYLEKRLRVKGIMTTHYVSPTIWAWRAGRIKTIRKACDLMMTLFPFEKTIYDAAAIKAEYVGHPLADEIIPSISKETDKQQLNLDVTKKTIALLPGSRAGEIERMGPVFLATANQCWQQDQSLQFIVPLVDQARFEQFKFLTAAYPNLPIILCYGKAREVLKAADVALITSGTATLEAALLRCPMVMAYKTSPISAILGRLLIKIRTFSLPNILSNETLVPEFIQEEAVSPALAKALLQMLQQDQSQRLASFDKLHQQLKQNSYEKTAKILAKLIS